MQSEVIQDIKRIIIVFFLILIAAIVGYKVFDILTFRITGTDPSLSKVATISPILNVKFNKNLSGQNLKLSSSKDTVLSYKVEGKVLAISLNPPFKPGQSYFVDIEGIQATDGKQIHNKTLAFVPRYLPESSLTQAERDALLKQQTQYNQVVDDGLIKLLPFTGGGLEFKVDYTLTYQAARPIIKVFVTAPNSQGQQAGLDWIKSVGYNPTDYNIQLVTGSVQ